MKRSGGHRRITSRRRRDSSRIAWRKAGAAVYQVGRNASSHLENAPAWKPGGQKTLAPARSEAYRAFRPGGGTAA